MKLLNIAILVISRGYVST